MAKRPRPRTGPADRKLRRTAASQPALAVRTIVPAAPPPLPLSVPAPAPAAVGLFERAMQALQRHAFREAAEGFQALLDSFPAERGLRDRSQVYLALCHRELERRPVAPRTVEERLTAATAALNDGDDDEAQRLARSVLSEAPQQDLALYLLAAIEARRGAPEDALQLLARAIQINPEICAQARHDADFEDLRGLEAFRQLIDIPVTHGPHAPRRPRRGRGER